MNRKKRQRNCKREERRGWSHSSIEAARIVCLIICVYQITQRLSKCIFSAGEKQHINIAGLSNLPLPSKTVINSQGGRPLSNVYIWINYKNNSPLWSINDQLIFISLNKKAKNRVLGLINRHHHSKRSGGEGRKREKKGKEREEGKGKKTRTFVMLATEKTLNIESQPTQLIN